MNVEQQFATGYKLLNTLYKSEEIEAELPKMIAIFAETEALWEEYLALIPEKRVKYLMIGEAPPCGDEEEVQYIFNPKAEPRKLMAALSKAFFGEAIYKEVGMQETLAKLAERGFLAIDPIPFAMPYSKGGKRGRKGYETLLRQTAQTYFLEKLNDSGIVWDTDLKVAFYLRKTANILIDTFDGTLPIAELSAPVPISGELVGINAANYPDANVLRQIYGLADSD